MNSPVGTKVGEFKENIYANGAQMSARPKARLLDFWATWCMPCRRTFPLLKNLYAQYHSRGLDIVGLSSEDLAVLNSFQSQEKLPWPLVRDINGVQSQYYGVRGLPTLILTDSLGYVQKVWTGAPAPAQLESEIKKLLGVK
jgi:thiol-disulfide isomerase/thioredoxin